MDEPAPDGLEYHEDFVSPAEEAQLVAVLDGLDFRAVTMRGQVARRTVRHYGLDYAYETGELVPADPLPEAMGWLRDRCAALIGREPADLVQVLVSRYRRAPGSGGTATRRRSARGSPASHCRRRAACASSAP